MNWFIIIGTFLIVLYLILRVGNVKFWKSVKKEPKVAYSFFINNDCWFVIHPNEFKSKPKDGDWSGPYLVFVPGIGTIKVYGKKGKYEEKQKEFIKMIENL